MSRIRLPSLALVAPLLVALAVASSLPSAGQPVRTAAASASVHRIMAQDIRPIGEIQGTVGDDENAVQHRSPFAANPNAGQQVVQGVIFERTLARSVNFQTGEVSPVNGFFVQNTAATSDADPTTSDGIWVFMGRFETLRRDGGGFYTPQVGDEVVLRGPVAEFNNQTQLSNPFVLDVVRSGVDLDAELPPFDANPPIDATGRANPDEVNRYWERHEGMRTRVPTGSIVAGPAVVLGRELDGEVAVIHTDHPVAHRPEPYARRAFRDPHPLDNVPGERFDDGNAYRILLGSHGIKAAVGSDTATVAPSARSFDLVAAPVIGAVAQRSGKYTIQVETQPTFAAGPDPSLNSPPQPPDLAHEYSIATFNVENLYDFRDDPTDDCDFAGDPGCPPEENATFNYVPTSEAIYQAHLNELADQILLNLHSPDILLIQEAEDQDICVIAADGISLSCDTTNAPTPASSRDNKPDTLQELALLIASKGGPTYDAAFDRAGADVRGIVAAFLYRTDRVQLLPVPVDDPVLSDHPSVSYRGDPVASNARAANPKSLNALLPTDLDPQDDETFPTVHARGPQVALFRIKQCAGSSISVDLYAISNHFSSRPDKTIRRRREQARYTAALVGALQNADPQVRVVVGGDFNVQPRPDDPLVPPMPPSDQLAALYDQGLHSLYDRLLAEVPAAAYSYVFDHQAQVLDQIFVTDRLLAALETVRVAHVNSDWPSAVTDDGPRGASDHDPSVARFRFAAP